MGAVCSTVGAACNAIGGWLAAGWISAVSAAKWIWAKMCSLFSLTIDFLNNLFSGWFRYRSQRTYVESNGSRVEIGHEDLSIGVEVNRNRATSVPSVPANRSPQVPQENLGESPQVPQENLGEYFRNNVNDQQREQLALSRRFIDVLDDAVNNDEHHESMPESERKLEDFVRSPDMQRLQELNRMNTINPSLA